MTEPRFPGLDKAMAEYQRAASEIEEITARMHELEREIRQVRAERTKRQSLIQEAKKKLVAGLNATTPEWPIHFEDECEVRKVMDS